MNLKCASCMLTSWWRCKKKIKDSSSVWLCKFHASMNENIDCVFESSAQLSLGLNVCTKSRPQSKQEVLQLRIKRFITSRPGRNAAAQPKGPTIQRQNETIHWCHDKAIWNTFATHELFKNKIRNRFHSRIITTCSSWMWWSIRRPLVPPPSGFRHQNCELCTTMSRCETQLLCVSF